MFQVLSFIIIKSALRQGREVKNWFNHLSSWIFRNHSLLEQRHRTVSYDVMTEPKTRNLHPQVTALSLVFFKKKTNKPNYATVWFKCFITDKWYVVIFMLKIDLQRRENEVVRNTVEKRHNTEWGEFYEIQILEINVKVWWNEQGKIWLQSSIISEGKVVARRGKGKIKSLYHNSSWAL